MKSLTAYNKSPEQQRDGGSEDEALPVWQYVLGIAYLAMGPVAGVGVIVLTYVFFCVIGEIVRGMMECQP